MQIAEMRVHTPDRNAHVFVELVTTEGHSGWGACYSERQQVVGAIGWLTRFVLGQNPLELEKLTETFHEISFWLGRGGAMTHAISGINLALWDCAGKILGIPVKTLLGGARHSDVKAYGSILFHPTETLETRIEEILERNFRAIKLGWDPFGGKTSTKIVGSSSGRERPREPMSTSWSTQAEVARTTRAHSRRHSSRLRCWRNTACVGSRNRCGPMTLPATAG